MDEQNLRPGGRREAVAHGRPGAVILLGAAAMAIGALTSVTALPAFAAFAGHPNGPEAPADPAGARLWNALVESAFLTASGAGVARFREWARTLFLALALVRAAALAYGLAQAGPGPGPDLPVWLARDLLLYGGGAWLLTRAHTVGLFRRDDP